MSKWLEAAEAVLRESIEKNGVIGLTNQQLFEAIKEKKLVKLVGTTPINTMNARLNLDIKRNPNSVFVKPSVGIFSLKEVILKYRPELKDTILAGNPKTSASKRQKKSKQAQKMPPKPILPNSSFGNLGSPISDDFRLGVEIFAAFHQASSSLMPPSLNGSPTLLPLSPLPEFFGDDDNMSHHPSVLRLPAPLEIPESLNCIAVEFRPRVQIDTLGILLKVAEDHLQLETPTKCK